MKLIFLVVIFAALLSGCATLPKGSFNGFSKNPMDKIIVVKYPGVNSLPFITSYEWGVVKQMAESCQAQISPQMSSASESALMSAGSGGIAGAIGIGLGSLFFPGSIIERYAGYGGAAGAMAGGAYGLTMWSFSNVSAISSCTRDFTRRAGLQNIFVYPAYVRSEHPKIKTKHHGTLAPVGSGDVLDLQPTPLP